MLIKMFWMVVVVVLVGGGDVWGQTDREQALEDAVANCDTALVKLLLEAGADPNVHNPYGTTVLERAVANCDTALVKLLLDAGADPNVHNPYGTTVLERAVANCDTTLVKLLLDAGADPNLPDNPYGTTVLEKAVSDCNTELVRMLLEAGADPNVHNPYGTTVLEKAVANCDAALVKLLLDAGADPTGQGPAHTAAILEIPSNGETLSGIGVISGWKCEAAGDISVRLNDGDPIPATYGLPRADTSTTCDDDGNNGFFSYTNWGNLGDGEHTAIVYDNGVEFGRSTFTVVTTGEAFLVGASKRVTVKDFPEPGETTILEWNQSTQHFEMVAVMSQAPADLGMCTEGLTVRPRQSCTGTILAFNYTFSVNAAGEGCLSGTPLDGCWSEPALLPAEASDLGVGVSKNDDGSWTITGLP